MTTLKLSDLAGPDAAGWSDVAVFVDERGRESQRFVFHGISTVPGWGQAADVRYEHGGGMSEPCLSRPVRRLGRGRLQPARIVMEGEAGATARELNRANLELDARAERAEEQVRLLREALETALTKFNEADDERLQETEERYAEAVKWKVEGDMYGWNFHQGVAGGCTTTSIVFHRVKRCIEAALAATAPTPTEERA